MSSLYIKTAVEKGKADWLLTALGSLISELNPKELQFDSTGATVIVCVADNGPFEVAGVCATEQDLKEFKRRDGRPKRWLLFPRDIVLKLCPDAAKELASPR